MFTNAFQADAFQQSTTKVIIGPNRVVPTPLPRGDYTPDIRLVQYTNFPSSFEIDWVLLNDGTLDDTQSLATAVIVALGTNRLALPSDILPDPDSTDRQGWWGDLDAEEISAATYHNGVRREVAEEIIIRGPIRESVRALLNDDSTEVGRVHLGVVHVFELENTDVRPGESEITELGFLTRDELRERYDALENWSRICVDGLDGLLGAS